MKIESNEWRKGECSKRIRRNKNKEKSECYKRIRIENKE